MYNFQFHLKLKKHEADMIICAKGMSVKTFKFLLSFRMLKSYDSISQNPQDIKTLSNSYFYKFTLAITVKQSFRGTFNKGDKKLGLS